MYTNAHGSPKCTCETPHPLGKVLALAFSLIHHLATGRGWPPLSPGRPTPYPRVWPCTPPLLLPRPQLCGPPAGTQSSSRAHSGAALGNSLGGLWLQPLPSTQERQPPFVVKPSPGGRGCQCIQYRVVTAPRCPAWPESLRTGCLTVTCRLYVKAPFTA